MDCISTLVSDIQLNNLKMNYLTAVFLDLTGACDHVSISILQRKLLSLSYPAKVINAIMSILKFRQLYVKHKHKTLGPRLTYIGLPQGSVVARILFNIYTNDIKFLITIGIHFLQYVDDVCFYCINASFMKTISDFNQFLTKIRYWDISTASI